MSSIESLGGASVVGLAEQCGVTSQTIRRDLQKLESQGLLQKGHGMALAGPGSTAIAYRDRNVHLTDLKRRLVARLGDFIEPGYTLFVGLGTTFNSIHEVLRARARLVVATNNLGVAYACTFNTNVSLFVFGGYVRRNDTAILPSGAGRPSDRFRFDLAIIGANAIAADGTVLVHDPLEVEFAQDVLAAARRTVLVVQADKFGGRAPHVLTHLRHVSVLITNCDPATRLDDPSVLQGMTVAIVE